LILHKKWASPLAFRPSGRTTSTIESKTDRAHPPGLRLGRKQAFAALAGRCSAADAECLRQARRSPTVSGWRDIIPARCSFCGNGLVFTAISRVARGICLATGHGIKTGCTRRPGAPS
jgi:hypothetical protein